MCSSDLRWIAAFPNPSNPDGDEEEVIYEDWGEMNQQQVPTHFSYLLVPCHKQTCPNKLALNGHSLGYFAARFTFRGCLFTVCVCVLDCPQVQCVEQYIAQQTDELTLEPTEIINVVRKTSGGKQPDKASGLVTFLPPGTCLSIRMLSYDKTRKPKLQSNVTLFPL